MEIVLVPTPNQSPKAVDVQFVVLHYTATNWETAIEIFTDPLRQVSTHFLIGLKGEVAEIVPALPTPKQAWHAGISHYQDQDGHSWENLNAYAIGIELVNFNGNLFPYTHDQYNTLIDLLEELFKLYPILNSPTRLLGHQDIAGFRGKIDPGSFFDWPRLFSRLFTKEIFLKNSFSPKKGLQLPYSKTVQSWYDQLDMTSTLSSYWSNQSLCLESLLAKEAS